LTKVQQKNIDCNTPPLDKLAQLTHCTCSDNSINTVKTLQKRAKAKYLTNAYTKKLASLKTGLQKSYNNTIYGCSNILEQTDNKIKGHYCKNRWCIVCNRIRTAKLINGYKTVLEKLPNKYFVTLTVPNVKAEVLRSTIKEMTHTFQNVRKHLQKKKVYIKGLRKLECTYNAIRNDFHPHFHFIVSDKANAEVLLQEWLKRYPEANEKGQNIREANEGSTLELFKYFSKIITNKVIYIRALDIIFIAMQGLRVYQPLGIKKVSEDIEEIQTQIIEDLKAAEKVWTWIENDWIDKETGECLTNYEPDEFINTLVSKNIFLDGDPPGHGSG
jgi:plasmid rolling circle replication initiator protein Rep